MTIDTTTNVLIVIIPVLILGFLIGTGIWRRFSRSFWFFVFGCAAGMAIMVMLEVTFATETIMLLTSISLNRFFGSLVGRNPNQISISTSNPLCIFGVVVITLIVVASVIDWNPKR